jgi:hypothetical protein
MCPDIRPINILRKEGRSSVQSNEGKLRANREGATATGVSPTKKTPNFLLIGAAKSGTSALWYYLRQHPQVFMLPRKHTRFFAYDVEEPDFRGPPPGDPGTPYSVVHLEDYHALFKEATKETAIGEASWTYLYRPEAAGRIKRYAQEHATTGIKLIAILRNPADRAYSHYRTNLVRAGRETIDDFERALEEEERRIREQWWPEFHYVSVGLYAAQLKRYFELFDRKQIKIYLNEDFNSDPAGLLRDLFRFLEVDDTFTPEAFVQYNSAGTPKNKVLNSFLRKMKGAKPMVERFLTEGQRRHLVRLGSELHKRNLVRPELPSEVRRRVTDKYFREDILALQDLIRRDLSAWLK